MKSLSGPELRAQFSQISRSSLGEKFVYLDSAASTLKPDVVVDRVSNYYKGEVSNIHRGGHYFGDLGTQHYEAARSFIAKQLSVENPDEIIFTRGTTESLNLVASGLGECFLKEGDLILLTEMEHHSNIVPWQILAEKMKLEIQFLKVTEKGDLDLIELDRLLKRSPKLMAFTAVSNVLGTVNPVKEITKKLHEVGALSIVDGAQAFGSGFPDLTDWGCDFFAFSGHKLFGPTGIGCLYGQARWLNEMPPYQGGGSMIREVTTEGSTFLEAPFRFEAGTPNVAGALGLHSAFEFISSINFTEWVEREKKLLHEFVSFLNERPSLRLLPSSDHSMNVCSFVSDQMHHQDIAQILSEQGVAVRAGHHCCQPLMAALGVPGSVRISLSVYSDDSDFEKFKKAYFKVEELLL